MVTSSKDAYTLAEKVQETGLTLTIGYNTPCTPNFYYTREIIRSGEFGKLELVIGFILRKAGKGALPERGGRIQNSLVADRLMIAARTF